MKKRYQTIFLLLFLICLFLLYISTSEKKQPESNNAEDFISTKNKIRSDRDCFENKDRLESNLPNHNYLYSPPHNDIIHITLNRDRFKIINEINGRRNRDIVPTKLKHKESKIEFANYPTLNELIIKSNSSFSKFTDLEKTLLELSHKEFILDIPNNITENTISVQKKKSNKINTIRINDNLILVKQILYNHHADIKIDGKSNAVIEVRQTGINNYSQTEINGNYNASSIMQMGYNNTGKIKLSGNNNDIVEIWQSGFENEAKLGIDGEFNEAAIMQSGKFNQAEIDQSGYANAIVEIWQSGNNNQGNINIDGNFNEANITQLGKSQHCSISQKGNRNRANNVQTQY